MHLLVHPLVLLDLLLHSMELLLPLHLLLLDRLLHSMVLLLLLELLLLVLRQRRRRHAEPMGVEQGLGTSRDKGGEAVGEPKKGI